MLKKTLPIIAGFLGLLLLAVIFSQVTDRQKPSAFYIASVDKPFGDGMGCRHILVRQLSSASHERNVLRGRVSKEEIEQIGAEGKCLNALGYISLPRIENSSAERIYIFTPLDETVRSDAPKLDASACFFGAIKDCPWQQIF